MLCLVTVAQAQVSDTASLNYNNQSTVKEAHDQAGQDNSKQDDSEQNDSKVESTSGVREGTISSEKNHAQQLPEPTEEQTDQDTDGSGQNPGVTDKVGPKGERLFLKKGNYYYTDEKGKKVKVKKSQLKDKADKD